MQWPCVMIQEHQWEGVSHARRSIYDEMLQAMSTNMMSLQVNAYTYC